MENITADQLRVYAEILIKISSALKKIARTNSISDPNQFQRLLNFSELLLIEANNLIDRAINVAVEGATQAADRIIASTNRTLNTINTITEIGKVLDIITGVLNVFTAITTGIASGSAIVTIGGALSSLENLLDTI